VREALGSALESRGAFEGAKVLDLFAGSGALSFEALSRGASDAVLVDADPRTVRQIRQSARELGLDEEVRVARLDLLGEPENVVRKLPASDLGFSLVFADAPYSEVDSIAAILDALVSAGRLAVGAWLVVEHPAGHDWIWPNVLAPEAEYRYGQTAISLGTYAAEKGKQ